MVYVAAGVSGLTGIVGTFFVKDYLGLSAAFLAALAFWANIPWALKMPLGHLVDLIWRWKALLVWLGAGLIAASVTIMYALIAHTEAMTAILSAGAWYVMAVLLAPTLQAHRAAIKPDIVWNVEKGLTQSWAQVAGAERHRSALIAAFDTFLDRHGFLVLPAAQTLPFAVAQRHPTEIADRALSTYVDWIAITFAITLMACPVIVVPCGFSREGLPVGMQIVAPRRRERELLRVAAHCERVWGAGRQVPRDPA